MEYDYKCPHCGLITTVNCKASEYESEIQCGCGGSAKRMFSATRTLYKCGGFFTTDRDDK